MKYLISDDHKIRKLFRRVEVFIILTFTLGAVLYADTFHIWEHALSEIGTTRTLKGTPNLLATTIITLGMILTNAQLLEIAALYRKNTHFPHHRIKSIFMYMAGAGALISVFPNNHFHLIHSIGSGMMIGPFYIINLLFLWERREDYAKVWFFLLMSFLSISVLWYAATFFMNHEYGNKTDRSKILCDQHPVCAPSTNHICCKNPRNSTDPSCSITTEQL
ncbi:MAG: hypothetical protein R6U57_10380 [Anaerolineales bacterium]